MLTSRCRKRRSVTRGTTRQAVWRGANNRNQTSLNANSYDETMRMRPRPEGMRINSMRRPMTPIWRGTVGRAASDSPDEADRRKGSGYSRPGALWPQDSNSDYATRQTPF